jgi:hypothetical protein
VLGSRHHRCESELELRDGSSAVHGRKCRARRGN